jgi:integrase
VGGEARDRRRRRQGTVLGSRKRQLGLLLIPALTEPVGVRDATSQRRESGACRRSRLGRFPDISREIRRSTERGTPFTADAINRLVKIIGTRAELPFPVHFHMLRHSSGYALANAGADPRAIQDLGPSFYHACGSLHRIEHDAVQGLLEAIWPTRIIRSRVGAASR